MNGRMGKSLLNLDCMIAEEVNSKSSVNVHVKNHINDYIIKLKLKHKLNSSPAPRTRTVPYRHSLAPSIDQHTAHRLVRGEKCQDCGTKNNEAKGCEPHSRIMKEVCIMLIDSSLKTGCQRFSGLKPSRVCSRSLVILDGTPECSIKRVSRNDLGKVC